MLRIAGNETGGTFSAEWVSLDETKDIIEANSKDQQYFRSSVLMTLFVRKSNNNHGYLAAILISEGVLKHFPEQPAQLLPGSWETITEKIDNLKSQDISLTDHIAIALKK